jgi:hypothetical protein
MPIQSYLSKLGLSRLSHLISLALVGAGLILMVWVGQLTWTDMSEWGKDIGSIFLGSRTGEAINLGIGMTVLNYFLISLALIGAGAVLLLKNRILALKSQLTMRTKPEKADMPTPIYPTYQTNQTSQTEQTIDTDTETEIKPTLKDETAAAQEERFFSGCLHHFGYLSSRPSDSPIPQECILCQRLGDCMVATVYVNKLSD